MYNSDKGDCVMSSHDLHSISMNQSPPNDGTTTSGPEPTPGPDAGDGSPNSITLHTTVIHGSPHAGLSVESSDTKMKEDAKTSTTTALIDKTDASSNMVNIKPNPNVDIEIAWFQVITTIRRVSSLKQISGREFIILNGWGFLLLVLFNGALFAALAAVSIRYTKGFAPASDQGLALACLVMAWLLLVVELLFTSGYLLTQLHHPLVRSRGAKYILVTALGVFVTVTPFAIITMIQIGAIRYSKPLMVSLVGLSTAGSIMFLGAQGCRQRLIYLLFEVKMKQSRKIYRHSYLCVFVWALFIGSVTLILSCMKQNRLAPVSITILVGLYAVLLVTAYYTYKSRHVTVAFSDWRSNLQVALFYTSMSTTVFALRVAYSRVFTNPIPETEAKMITIVFITFYSVYCCMSTCTVLLFGQITLIVVLNLKTVDDLDPLAIFENRQKGASDTGFTQKGLIQPESPHVQTPEFT